MILHRAAWVLPIARPPIANGWVATENGRIAALGGPDAEPPRTAVAAVPASDRCAILPGLVNAHTHLELSCLRGHVSPRDRFDDWIRDVIAARRRSANTAVEIVDAVRTALREAHRSGTGLFGDISNTLVTLPVFREAGVRAHVFYELIGFSAPDPDGAVRQARERIDAHDTSDLRVSVAPHAPYSVSPALFHAIRRDLDAHSEAVASVHLGESREEVEFLLKGTGQIRMALEELGAWNPAWTPPCCGPIAYLAQFGLLNDRLLVVHGVQLTDDEIRRLADAGSTIVTCPRSNRWTGAGTPPLSRFYASGARVAVGTDSLASVEDLNLFNELAAIREIARDVPARAILDSATRIGAAALGFGGELGTIEPGKRAELLSIRTPPGLEDVEEYLLSGITAADIRWLESG